MGFRVARNEGGTRKAPSQGFAAATLVQGWTEEVQVDAVLDERESLLTEVAIQVHPERPVAAPVGLCSARVDDTNRPPIAPQPGGQGAGERRGRSIIDTLRDATLRTLHGLNATLKRVSESQPRLSDPSQWSPRELLTVAVLLVLLVALVGLRLDTRRPDTARIPALADVLVLHAAGLRADSVSVADLAADLGLPIESLLYWPNTFAQSSDPLRSSLSLLRGDLALNLDSRPGPDTLVPRLRSAGYTTSLVSDSPRLFERVDGLFDKTFLTQAAEQLADESARLWRETTADGPAMMLVDVNFAGAPLHGETTAAVELRARHSERLMLLRGVLAQISQATSRSARPQLVVLMGASGLELGEHPDDTESPFDTHLRVPFLIGLRSGSGLPSGAQPALVQSADLAPTLMDFLDLRSRSESAQDDLLRLGRSLEASSHGWKEGPVHEVLYLVGSQHAVARSRDWKLISDVEAPWKISAERSRLYSLAEDPGESRDLLSEGAMGPVTKQLFDGLQSWLSRPIALASSPQEQAR